MLKEENFLLKIELKKNEESCITHLIMKIFEAFYELFDLILENPIENFWYEFIAIIMGYLQIMYYLVDKTVSN